jgi:hypothetical protein
LPSTEFVFAHGETTRNGWRGPKPQRPCSPPSGCDDADSTPQSPDVPEPFGSFVFVRLSATDADGL